MTQTDLFADHPDAEHPVRWQPADGDTPKYVPMFEAVRRLVNYGVGSRKEVERMLRGGSPLRTPFAFYQLHEVPEKDA